MLSYFREHTRYKLTYGEIYGCPDTLTDVLVVTLVEEFPEVILNLLMDQTSYTETVSLMLTP